MGYISIWEIDWFWTLLKAVSPNAIKDIGIENVFIGLGCKYPNPSDVWSAQMATIEFLNHSSFLIY